MSGQNLKINDICLEGQNLGTLFKTVSRSKQSGDLAAVGVFKFQRMYFNCTNIRHISLHWVKVQTKGVAHLQICYLVMQVGVFSRVPPTLFRVGEFNRIWYISSCNLIKLVVAKHCTSNKCVPQIQFINVQGFWAMFSQRSSVIVLSGCSRPA